MWAPEGEIHNFSEISPPCGLHLPTKQSHSDIKIKGENEAKQVLSAKGDLFIGRYFFSLLSDLSQKVH